MLNEPLTVFRTLSTGKKITLGQLVENKTGTYFQYDQEYLSTGHSLSPFRLRFDNTLQKSPDSPHHGLHGVFGDSLPDGWGLYLMDRVFRQRGYDLSKITALERLAYIGKTGLGCLSYKPESNTQQTYATSLIKLGQEATKEFEGTESKLIDELSHAAGSGGARPKINIRICDDILSTHLDGPGNQWMIKFTSKNFLLGHQESQVEATYMHMASELGFNVTKFKLFDAGNNRYWLGQQRFDCIDTSQIKNSKQTYGGRVHLHSACGLLDANFREPSLDYIDLIKAAKVLCGVKDAQDVVKRALFNYLTLNQDDHSKNWSFICNDNGQWSLSPFYDIVYSPSPYGEHMTSYNGSGKMINHKTLELMAQHAGLRTSKPLYNWIDEIKEVIENFDEIAKLYNVKKKLVKEIIAAVKQVSISP